MGEVEEANEGQGRRRLLRVCVSAWSDATLVSLSAPRGVPERNEIDCTAAPTYLEPGNAGRIAHEAQLCRVAAASVTGCYGCGTGGGGGGGMAGVDQVGSQAPSDKRIATFCTRQRQERGREREGEEREGQGQP